jgi:hypothetical protein
LCSRAHAVATTFSDPRTARSPDVRRLCINLASIKPDQGDIGHVVIVVVVVVENKDV